MNDCAYAMATSLAWKEMNAGGMGWPTSLDLLGIKVLVVEDEAFIAVDLESMLRELGCDVLPLAPSVAEALAILRTERPDAALLDVRLTDGEVTPVAAALAAIGVPFALVTGCDDRSLGGPLLRAARRLRKPYVPEDVHRMLLGPVQPS
jgi:CheY-like chemotaxis protein